MGRRGRPPKPSALKRLQGTYRPDRDAKNPIKVSVDAPEAPDWLDDDGRAEWDFIVPELDKAGILATIDRTVLANYCSAAGLAKNATIAYQTDGLMLGVGRFRKKHPMIKVAQEARQQARQLGAELGLSPSARTRVSVPDNKVKRDKDDSEAFLFTPLVINGGKTK